MMTTCDWCEKRKHHNEMYYIENPDHDSYCGGNWVCNDCLDAFKEEQGDEEKRGCQP